MPVYLKKRRRSETLSRALGALERVYVQVSSLRNASASGDTSREAYMDQLRMLKFELARWAEDAAVPGIGAYAQDEYNDPAYNFPSQMAASITAAQGLHDWLDANIPVSGGERDIYTYDANGNRVAKTVTPAQTAGYRAAADVFLATVDNVTT